MRHKVVVDDDENFLSNAFNNKTLDIDGEPPIKLAQIVEEKTHQNKFYCGCELCPTKNKAVYDRFFSETQNCPSTFYAITWHENLSCKQDRYPSLESVKLLPHRNLLLHCAAKDLSRANAEEILNHAINLGITNIFALRGNGEEAVKGDFPHASDFVSFIREQYGQQFCIAVAGYPEMHPKSLYKNLDLHYLKKKVDAGADLIISQIFFESELFIKFVKDCRDSGISVPIIPGIFPFSSVHSLKKMSTICEVRIPSWLSNKLRDIEADDEAVNKFGIDLSVKNIIEIWKSGVSNGYHLFSLNRSFAAIEIQRQLSLNNYVLD